MVVSKKRLSKKRLSKKKLSNKRLSKKRLSKKKLSNKRLATNKKYINNFKELNCSPNKKLNFTCYDNEELNRLKTSWNSYYPNNKILTNNNKKIWEFLQKELINNCDTEQCWLKQDFMNNRLTNKLLTNTFAPKSPDSWKTNPNEWLSSEDIIKVMRQYEHTYPEFKFIGPSPIDFDYKKGFGQCVWNELCNLDIKDLIKKKNH